MLPLVFIFQNYMALGETPANLLDTWTYSDKNSMERWLHYMKYVSYSVVAQKPRQHTKQNFY